MSDRNSVIEECAKAIDCDCDNFACELKEAADKIRALKDVAPDGQIFKTDAFDKTLGIIRLEEWPEGVVLWVGGEIKWKSWA